MLRLLLALSVGANLYFFFRPTPSTPMDQFGAGFWRALAGGEITCAEKHPICHEGETLARILKLLQTKAPLTAKDIAHRPDELLMWGLALSTADPQSYLALPLSPLEKEYFTDGLGFGYALFDGVDRAKTKCALNPFCHWGIGRALYFLSLHDEDPRERAGNVFARVRMGGESFKEAELKSPQEKLAVDVARSQRGEKISRELPLKCLGEHHILACARP